jgi:large subunit ribosomal protein L3
MAFRMGLLGKKIGMTQKFSEKGEWIPLSVIQLGPCVVLDVKTDEHNGYTAIQLGFDEKPARLTKRPETGVFAKAKTTPKRFVREIRLVAEDTAQFKIGQTVSVAQVFKPGDIIDVVGTSRGKGFQGVMKKHHMAGFRASHGTHEYFRHGGSIGCRLTPGHVHKGKRMPSQMGNQRVTVQNIRVHEIIADKNLLLLRGAVPGAPKGYLVLKHATKRPYRPFRLPEAQPQG